MMTNDEKKAVQRFNYGLTQWQNQPQYTKAVVKQMVQRGMVK